jgi:hypothetical protein
MQGACSHHGGVDDSIFQTMGLISFLMAITAAASPAVIRRLLTRPKVKRCKTAPHVKRDTRPVSPYGSKAKHRAILLESGASPAAVEEVVSGFADD